MPIIKYFPILPLFLEQAFANMPLPAKAKIFPRDSPISMARKYPFIKIRHFMAYFFVSYPYEMNALSGW